jgi:hypothetical protein
MGKKIISPLTVHLINKRGKMSSDGSLMGSSVIVGSSWGESVKTL